MPRGTRKSIWMEPRSSFRAESLFVLAFQRSSPLRPPQLRAPGGLLSTDLTLRISPRVCLEFGCLQDYCALLLLLLLRYQGSPQGCSTTEPHPSPFTF